MSYRVFSFIIISFDFLFFWFAKWYRSRAVISQQSRESSPASVRLCLFAWLSFCFIFFFFFGFFFSFIFRTIFLTFFLFLFRSLFVLGREIVAGGTSRDKPRPTCRRPFRLLQHNTDTPISFQPVSTMLSRKQLLRLDVFKMFFNFFFFFFNLFSLFSYFAWLAASTPSRFSSLKSLYS